MWVARRLQAGPASWPARGNGMKNRAFAARAAGLFLGTLALAGCGEEKKDSAPAAVPCMPEPTLRCVTNLAMEVAGPVMADKAQRDFLSLDPAALLDLAQAINKLGGETDRAWMLQQARAVPTATNPLAAARLLGRAGDTEGARALVRRSLTADDEYFKTRIDKGQLGSAPLSGYVEILVNAGLAAEAAPLLKGWIAAETPKLGKLSPSLRALYLGDGAFALFLIGDAAASRDFAGQAVAALDAIEDAEARAERALGVAADLLKANLADGARAALQRVLKDATAIKDADTAEARAAQAHRLLLRAERLRKDEAGAEAARAALRALRQKYIDANKIDAARTSLSEDFRAALAAGDREEAQRIRDQALGLLAAAPKGEPPPEPALREAAEMQSALGDDAGALATIRRIKDDPTDWSVPSLIASNCKVLSANGHWQGALRCAARLTDRRPLYLQRRLETYAKIAGDMAR